MNENKIAVIIPCYNEEQAIEKVIKDFHKVYQKPKYMFMTIIQQTKRLKSLVKQELS